jgi:hypothetical protein
LFINGGIMKFGKRIALAFVIQKNPDLRLQRTIGILAPVRHELVERDRIHHGP